MAGTGPRIDWRGPSASWKRPAPIRIWFRELRRRGHNCVAIAAILNHEGWRPPKRRDTFNGPMVRRVLIGAGLIEAKRRAARARPQRRPAEWTINELPARI